LDLLGRERDLGVAAAYNVHLRVERQVADPQHGGSLGRSSPRECTQARAELAEVEGLGEVVVGADFEAGCPVVDGVARREDEYRRFHTRFTQAAAGLQAVDAREHQIQDDDVVGRCRRHPERVLAAPRGVRENAGFAEPLADELCELGLVLDD
jgi:hypothetical protein